MNECQSDSTATCPLVTKVHVEVAKMRNQAREVVMIGHNGHPEVEGTMGQSRDGMYLVETPEDVRSLKVGTPEKLSLVTQTTLSVDDASVVIAAFKGQFPEVQGPKKDDICYATQNRQDAVKTLAAQCAPKEVPLGCDVVIVFGSPNSSNSRRLREVAIARGGWLSGRWPRRDRVPLVLGQGENRRDCWCVGPGNSGSASR
jgi:4-hydroxy-3-methylbut-2-enyl diphosphate reductase